MIRIRIKEEIKSKYESVVCDKQESIGLVSIMMRIHMRFVMCHWSFSKYVDAFETQRSRYGRGFRVQKVIGWSLVIKFWIGLGSFFVVDLEKVKEDLEFMKRDQNYDNTIILEMIDHNLGRIEELLLLIQEYAEKHLTMTLKGRNIFRLVISGKRNLLYGGLVLLFKRILLEWKIIGLEDDYKSVSTKVSSSSSISRSRSRSVMLGGFLREEFIRVKRMNNRIEWNKLEDFSKNTLFFDFKVFLEGLYRFLIDSDVFCTGKSKSLKFGDFEEFIQELEDFEASKKRLMENSLFNKEKFESIERGMINIRNKSVWLSELLVKIDIRFKDREKSVWIIKMSKFVFEINVEIMVFKRTVEEVKADAGYSGDLD